MTKDEYYTAKIRSEYAPYDSAASCKPAFDEGMVAAQANNYTNPYEAGPGYKAQAWDRGFECQRRLEREFGREEAVAEAARVVAEAKREGRIAFLTAELYRLSK